MIPEGRGVYIRVRVKAGRREEFLGLITQLVSDVHANEKDTLVFELMQAADPDEFVLVERFTSKAAQAAHQNAPYHVAMAAKGLDCLEGTPHIEQLTPIAP